MKKPNFSWKRVADSFSTRSFRAGGYSVAAAAIVLAIAVMVNVFAAALPASVTKFDTTANQLFTLSAVSYTHLDVYKRQVMASVSPMAASLTRLTRSLLPEISVPLTRVMTSPA